MSCTSTPLSLLVCPVYSSRFRHPARLLLRAYWPSYPSNCPPSSVYSNWSLRATPLLHRVPQIFESRLPSAAFAFFPCHTGKHVHTLHSLSMTQDPVTASLVFFFFSTFTTAALLISALKFFFLLKEKVPLFRQNNFHNVTSANIVCMTYDVLTMQYDFTQFYHNFL